MDVQGNASVSAPMPTPKPASHSAKTLDYDSFLQLMLAQMKNQDPTEPVDPTTQMAQLASFSQVEQAIKTNAKLDAMLTSAALAQADGIIGRTVTAPNDGASGEAVALTVSADGPVAILRDGREIPLGPGVKIS